MTAKYRKVVVEATVRYEVEVPEDHTPHDIEFYYNDGTWCASNIVQDLTEYAKNRCMCDDVVIRYVSEVEPDGKP